MEQWWNNTVFYEIYMTSFCDSNGDSVGDIPGIISKLPYLKELGVGGIWLTPFYPSPKVDNGYDISDYYGVDEAYGSMMDFERLITTAHELGIKIIVDIVVNHTSTEHQWFLESCSSKENSKRDWYVWRDPVDGREPNNWESFFGGSAWEYDEKSNQYYYHSFAKEQVDLNWQNPEVKDAINHVIDYWLEKGVDGFRFDVINNLTISSELVDNPTDEKGEQLHVNDVNQPGIHKVIADMCGRIKERKPDAFLVGEISSDKLEQIYSYTVSAGLDTTFNFNLGSRDRFEFEEIMAELDAMQDLYGAKGNSTMFFGSHDMKRFPDRFSFSTGQVKCLLMLMMVSKAIPFLYFGDELGMRNRILTDIEEARDVQGILAYEVALKEGKSQQEAITLLNEKSRDASRNPMDWKMATEQIEESSSIWNFVRSLIEIRRSEKAMTLGAMKLSKLDHGVMVIERRLENTYIRTVINFSDRAIPILVATDEQVILASETELAGPHVEELQLHAGSCVMLKHICGRKYNNA